MLFVAPVCLLAQSFPTAVHTLAATQTSRWTTGTDPLLAVQGACAITGAGLSIRCPPPPPRQTREGRQFVYTVLLFRDLDDNLYLAACNRRPAPDPCEELRAGQTFSAEVEDLALKIVIGDQQYPLRILEKRPKEQAIDSPTRGTPSLARPSTGAPSAVPYSQVKPSLGTSSRVPYSQTPPSEGSPSPGAPSDVRPAVTSPTGARLYVSCAVRSARIYVDNQFLGRPPVEAPLRPGRYTVLVQAPGYRNWVQTVELASGATLRLTAELRR